MSDGTLFASEGVIVVTIAYRLGAFGFLELGGLLGKEYEGSANNGLRDAIAAFEWVKNNIASFGGDPHQVTVGGQSAGAKLTGMLMGTPNARPFFHQMISESGGAERIATLDQANSTADGFAKVWNSKTGGDPTSLMSAHPATIIDAQNTFMETWPQHFPLRCVIDGNLIARLPVDSIARGLTKSKRLLIGTNRDESAAFYNPSLTRDVTASDLGNVTLADFNRVASQYSSLYPELSPVHQRIRALTAEEYLIPSIREVSAHVLGGGTAFMYRLDFTETSGELASYAYHSLELGMAWGKPHRDVANAADEIALGKIIHASWLAFIQGEPPLTTGLSEWPNYEVLNKFDITGPNGKLTVIGERSTMVFDTPCAVLDNPEEAELQLWNAV
jgi:para-nitrobenzyl esterase